MRVRVVPAHELDAVGAFPAGARVVVDATHLDRPPLALLARLVLVRRRLRAAGGDLVLAVNAASASGASSGGLHWTVPCHGDVRDALSAIDPSTARAAVSTMRAGD